MKYEFEMYCDGVIGIRKIEMIPLWNMNLIFNDIGSLKKYLSTDFKLRCSISDVMELLNNAQMNEWVEFK